MTKLKEMQSRSDVSSLNIASLSFGEASADRREDETLEKIRKTISYLSPAVIGIVYIWTNIDITFHTMATTLFLESTIDYIEIFLKKSKYSALIKLK